MTDYFQFLCGFQGCTVRIAATSADSFLFLERNLDQNLSLAEVFSPAVEVPKKAKSGETPGGLVGEL